MCVKSHQRGPELLCSLLHVLLHALHIPCPVHAVLQALVIDD